MTQKFLNLKNELLMGSHSLQEKVIWIFLFYSKIADCHLVHGPLKVIIFVTMHACVQNLTCKQSLSSR